MGRHGLLRTTIGVSVGIALSVWLRYSSPRCGDRPGTSTTIDERPASQVEASLPARVALMQAPQADVAEAAASNNAFSLDLFRSRPHEERESGLLALQRVPRPRHDHGRSQRRNPGGDEASAPHLPPRSAFAPGRE